MDMEREARLDEVRRARFELVYERHAPSVKAYMLRRAPSSVADDLVAEVFVVCWRRFEQVPADPLPWLFGVARRVLSTQRRGERRGIRLGERLAQAGAPASAAHEHVERGALRGALERLSDPDRELLLLIAWEGLSPTEAASVLELSPATVRVRLYRARRRLTVALAREGGEPRSCTALQMEASQ